MGVAREDEGVVLGVLREDEGVTLGVARDDGGVAVGVAIYDEGDGGMEVDKISESAYTENIDAEIKQESCDVAAGIQSDDESMEEGGQLEEEVVLKIVRCLEELRRCLETAQHTIVSHNNTYVSTYMLNVQATILRFRP